MPQVKSALYPTRLDQLKLELQRAKENRRWCLQTALDWKLEAEKLTKWIKVLEKKQ